MFVSHASVELLFRLVVTGEPGCGAPRAVDSAHAMFGGDAPSTRGSGAWMCRDYRFTPKGLGAVHGYTITMIVQGLDATGPGVDPCNLSGFQDVDGVLLLGRADTLPVTLGRCMANVRALRYDASLFPLVVGVSGDATPTELGALATRLGIGDRPVLALAPEDPSAVAAAVKASLKQMLVALRLGHIRKVEGTKM